MVWNLMNESSVRADGVELPNMHVKPYVEYGVGLQRFWSDKFSAFGQAMVRNGGRTGIAFTAGFRWALGSNETEVRNNERGKKFMHSVSLPLRRVKTGAATQCTQEALTVTPQSKKVIKTRSRRIVKRV